MQPPYDPWESQGPPQPGPQGYLPGPGGYPGMPPGAGMPPGPGMPPGAGMPPGPGVPQGPPPGAARKRTGRGPLIVVAVVGVLVVIGAAVLLSVRASQGKGRFHKSPLACPMLSQAQVNAYLPGAASTADLDGSMCTWEKPAHDRSGVGEVYVYVDTSDGSTVKDAKEQYGVRRRQDDKPGTTITAQSVGDESFMACSAAKYGVRICETYTRVSNVVFEVHFVSYGVPNAPDAGTAAQALTAEIAQRLGRSS
jgi:hypothetical protein